MERIKICVLWNCPGADSNKINNVNNKILKQIKKHPKLTAMWEDGTLELTTFNSLKSFRDFANKPGKDVSFILIEYGYMLTGSGYIEDMEMGSHTLEDFANMLPKESVLGIYTYDRFNYMIPNKKGIFFNLELKDYTKKVETEEKNIKYIEPTQGELPPFMHHPLFDVNSNRLIKSFLKSYDKSRLIKIMEDIPGFLDNIGYITLNVCADLFLRFIEHNRESMEATVYFNAYANLSNPPKKLAEWCEKNKIPVLNNNALRTTKRYYVKPLDLYKIIFGDTDYSLNKPESVDSDKEILEIIKSNPAILNVVYLIQAFRDPAVMELEDFNKSITEVLINDVKCKFDVAIKHIKENHLKQDTSVDKLKKVVEALTVLESHRPG